jgi:hypothetical protein
MRGDETTVAVATASGRVRERVEIWVEMEGRVCRECVGRYGVGGGDCIRVGK